MASTVSRRSFLRIAGALGAAAGLSATLGACAPRNESSSSADSSSGGSAQGAGSAKEDGTIEAAISYELGTNGYDPMTTTAALTLAANWHTMEGLTEMDPATGKSYAALATELPSADGTTVDVKLRDGAVFHNGEPVTAEDVVFSFERVLDEANKSLYAAFIPFIKSVKAKDDTTVTFELEYPTGLFADRLSTVKIVPKAAVEADPKAFDALPVGTGPYKMTDSGAASKTVKFERFEDYTGPKPARAAAMNWQIIPDPSTRTNAFQSKTAQAIDSVPYLSIDQLKASGTVESIQGFGLLFAMFNNADSSPFSKLEARQAFLYGIDMNKVIETGLLGQAAPATSFLQKDHPEYQEASTVYAYDPEKARELFKKAGVTSFRLLCTDHDWVKKCTPLIQESLSALGVKVTMEEKKSAEAYQTIDRADDSYDVLVAPGDPSVFGNDPDLLLRWWYGNDTWVDSRMHWKGADAQKEISALLDEAIRAESDADRKKAWGKTFDVISDNVPLYPLLHRKSPSAWDESTLVDFKPIALTGLSFIGVASTK
ncbi:ABC transporter substrate-binding protein [Corynebacterium lizhenjunii]|uniref:ABC transporter substrate-binding protein n=1 Tax=Corynebacterium lizhenjunii TaxID=2709394 RepID=UPI0013ED8631|nr:ABC transporter substrate-binding protein [Corynebacterium lizhenjunii]